MPIPCLSLLYSYPLIIKMSILTMLQRIRDAMFRKDRMRYSIVFWGELLGQALFAFININIINGIANPATPGPQKLIYTSLYYALSMFINISFARDFSGGVFNPATVLFRLFRRSDRYRFKTGVLYMVSELLGAVLGTLAGFYLCELRFAPIMVELPVKQQLVRCYSQMMATLMMTFMVQYSIEKKMTFISHNKEMYVWLPMLYMVVRFFNGKSNTMNPAFGLGYQLAWCYKFDRWDVFPMSYVLFFPPFVGAGMSVAFFQLILRRYFPLNQQEVLMILADLPAEIGQMGEMKEMELNDVGNRTSVFQQRISKFMQRGSAFNVRVSGLNPVSNQLRLSTTNQQRRVTSRVSMMQGVNFQTAPIQLKMEKLYDFGYNENLQDQEDIYSVASEEDSDDEFAAAVKEQQGQSFPQRAENSREIQLTDFQNNSP